MKLPIVIFILAMIHNGLAIEGPGTMYPFETATGTTGTTAIHKDDAVFSGWADGYANIIYGSNVDAIWQTPLLALGPAVGGASDIVCLGRGGQITLTFSTPIVDGSGFDFAVFENALDDDFLELGWVEVSSDGEHFCRFPNYYAGRVAVNPFDGHETSDIYGLASKYRNGYGHPFDLAELQEAYDALTPARPSFFTDAYADALATNFPFLILTHITHIRIIDIVGDGTAKATNGWPIYDPYPTIGSAGFDLDAIGVIHQAAVSGDVQTIEFESIPHQQLSFQQVELSASASSELPVSYSVQSGPAVVSGSLLSFTGTGMVEVVANQTGNEVYAPASPVLRSFYVAEEIQHIFVEPVPNQIQSSGDVQVMAYSSSGLPVYMQVYDGPDSVNIGETNHLLNLANEVGSVTLRAFQPGTGSVAPAEEVYWSFKIVESGASNAPLSFAEWSAAFGIPLNEMLDSDEDGVKNLQEFVMGSNPTNSSSMPEPEYSVMQDQYNRSVMRLSFEVNQCALGNTQIQYSSNLSDWTLGVPRIISTHTSQDRVELTMDLPTTSTNGFFRFQFQQQ
jgi:hypothetical protein